jgi:hypothetical protein
MCSDRHTLAIARQRHRDAKPVVRGLAVDVAAQLTPITASRRSKFIHSNMTRVDTSAVVQVGPYRHAIPIIRQRHGPTTEVNCSFPINVRPDLVP